MILEFWEYFVEILEELDDVLSSLFESLRGVHQQIAIEIGEIARSRLASGKS